MQSTNASEWTKKLQQDHGDDEMGKKHLTTAHIFMVPKYKTYFRFLAHIATIVTMHATFTNQLRNYTNVILKGEALNYKPVAKDAYIAYCKHKLQR